MVQPTLSQRIEEKLQSGDLAAAVPVKTWGGPSDGNVCAACDGSITRGAAELEAQCVDDRTRFYHIACYTLVEAMRRSRAR
jgi:hypothetical protein